jgi:hypothetical protein
MKLELDPLPLEGGELEDVASYSEPIACRIPMHRFGRSSWQSCAHRLNFRYACGDLPRLDADENPTCEAAELPEAGDHEGARELLMVALGQDLRRLDAHAHLGNLEFDWSPERAIVHDEIAVMVGELSLPTGFDGLLIWGRIYNRPFLHGYGLCLWCLGRMVPAQQVFERILSLNPDDDHGVRFCWQNLRDGRSWEKMREG